MRLPVILALFLVQVLLMAPVLAQGINDEWVQRDREISAEASGKLSKIHENYIYDLEKVETLKLDAEQRQQKLQELNARRESEREQVLAERKELILASAEERERRMSVLAGQLAQRGVLFTGGEKSADETSPGVYKSDNSAAAFYDQNCKSCHFYKMDESGTYPSLWMAVQRLSQSDFVRAVQTTSPMKDMPAVKDASKKEVRGVYDYILTWGDNPPWLAGGPQNDDPGADKIPDESAAAPAGPLPPAVRTSGGGPGPLAGTVNSPAAALPSTPGGPAVAGEVHDTQFGNAQLQCNVSGDELEVRWIAPYRSEDGWIPPPQDVQAADNAWVMRLRARLESPVDGAYPTEPRPGWCTWTDGSLGSAAGKNRDIVIYARMATPPFSSFVFKDGNADIYQHPPCCGVDERAGRFTLDVANAVHGVRLSDGRLIRGNGQVHTLVRMIDSRWGLEGAPAFIVDD